MKKYIISLLIMIFTFTSCGQSSISADTIQDIIAAIEYQEHIMDVSHQMAECARELKYEDDHVIIQYARLQYAQAKEFRDLYQDQLDNWLYMMKDAVVISVKEPVTEVVDYTEPSAFQTSWTGSKLTKSKGVNWGPQGKETYYNLNMSTVVQYMRDLGYDETKYPYWVRDDGCKMLGEYIMVAANLKHWPKGSIIECSLGWAIVCDTGDFVNYQHGWDWLDIATSW